MVMILSALLLMVLVRRLGLAIVEIEQSRVSHGAILKQVRLRIEAHRSTFCGGHAPFRLWECKVRDACLDSVWPTVGSSPHRR